MRIALGLTAALGALVLAGGVGAVPDAKKPKPQAKENAAKKTVCAGTVSGVVAGDLVVPQGSSCNASGAVVRRRVYVNRNATLTTDGAFSVGRGIDVARGATLQVVGTQIAIAGHVRAHGAKKVALIREPRAASSGVVGGTVMLSKTEDISVLSLTIGGGVRVHGGGGEGVEVGANRIFLSLDVMGARMLRPRQPRVFSIHSNVVSRHVRVLGNNATGASSPLFVGGNRLLRGHLTCRRNVPAPVNSGPGGTEPNVVRHGAKRGQCASL